MTTARRRTTTALVVLAATVVTMLAAELLSTVDGTSLWWVPAAIIVVHLPSDRLAVTMPTAAAVQLVAGLIATGGAALPTVLVSAVTVPAGYAAALVLVDVLRARWSGSLARAVSFLVGLVVVGPLSTAAVTQGTFVALGLADPQGVTSAAVSMAAADAAAIIAFAPALRMVTAPGWRPVCDARDLAVAAAFGVASAVAGFWSTAWWIGGRSMLFIGALPLLLATTARQPWVVRLVLATTGLGMALGLGLDRAGTVPVLDARIAFIGAAALALTITALARTGSTDGAASDRLVLAGVAVDGRTEVLARVAATVRRVRLGLVLVLGMEVVVRYRGTWEAEPLPLWLAALGAPALLLLANALSTYLDGTLGQSVRRQRLESALDVALALVLYTVFAPLAGMGSLPVGVFLVLAAVSLRLRPVEAFAAGAGLVLGLTAMRTLDPLPWTIVQPSFQVVSILPLATTALLVVWLISWTSQLLHASREQVTTLAGRLDLTNASMAVAGAQLEAAYAELAARTEELEAAHGEARAAADQEKAARDDYERFSALVAHDLASPMATIQGIARLLLRTDLDDDTRAELLASAANSASRAAALVDRLHDHARAGTTTLRRTDVPLTDVVRDVVSDLDAGLRATGSTVTWSEELPTVTADRVLLGQLLGNLLGNALRHGADDAGVARIAVAAHTTDGGTAITVTDRGPGIDPAVAGDLFSVGVRGTRSRGLGLGMATCRTIVERHDGELAIGPGPDGVGTTVTVTLPQRPLPDATVVHVREEPATSVDAPHLDRGGMRFDDLPATAPIVDVGHAVGR